MIRLIAKIPTHEIENDNVRWLVLEPHVHNNAIVGYFMYGHRDINEPASWDNWYQTLERALDHAKDYGVNKDDWRTESLN